MNQIPIKGFSFFFEPVLVVRLAKALRSFEIPFPSLSGLFDAVVFCDTTGFSDVNADGNHVAAGTPSKDHSVVAIVTEQTRNIELRHDPTISA